MAKLFFLRTSLSQILAQTVRELAIRYWVNAVRARLELYNSIIVRSCYPFNRGSSGRCHRLDLHHGGRRLCSDCSEIVLQLGIAWIIASRGHKEDNHRMHARYNVGGTNASPRIDETSLHKTADTERDAVADDGTFRVRRHHGQCYSNKHSGHGHREIFMASRLNVTGPHEFSRATNCTSRRRRLMISSRAERNKSS